jgi:hypothetical protein
MPPWLDCMAPPPRVRTAMNVLQNMPGGTRYHGHISTSNDANFSIMAGATLRAGRRQDYLDYKGSRRCSEQRFCRMTRMVPLHTDLHEAAVFEPVEGWVVPTRIRRFYDSIFSALSHAEQCDLIDRLKARGHGFAVPIALLDATLSPGKEVVLGRLHFGESAAGKDYEYEHNVWT